MQVRHSQRWGVVPEALLEDPRLSLEARAVAAWLAAKPDGWKIVIGVMLARLQLGRDRWSRIARELEAAGYLQRRRVAADKGQFSWHVSFIPCPTTIAATASNGAAVDGQPSDGANGDGSAVNGAAGNKTHQCSQNIETTTTTTTPGLISLTLERCIATSRDEIVALLDGVDVTRAQLIVDELAGAVEAAAAGRRRPVVSIRGWLTRVIELDRRGDFVPEFARRIATRRAEGKAATKQPTNRPPPENPEVRRQHARTHLANIEATLKRTPIEPTNAKSGFPSAVDEPSRSPDQLTSRKPQ
ncbi:MAG: hypothetical protein JO142_02060 [Burkholderiales bacterium]|nr:hypothetical protein [Burkholderiales bacterium]